MALFFFYGAMLVLAARGSLHWRNRNERHCGLHVNSCTKTFFFFSKSLIISCSSSLPLHFSLQPTHEYMHAPALFERTVDSELNVHLSQVYSLWNGESWMVREGATFMITYSFFVSSSSFSLSLVQWMVLCLRSTSPMHSLNRPFTCTHTLPHRSMYNWLHIQCFASSKLLGTMIENNGDLLRGEAHGCDHFMFSFFFIKFILSCQRIEKYSFSAFSMPTSLVAFRLFDCCCSFYSMP